MADSDARKRGDPARVDRDEDTRDVVGGSGIGRASLVLNILLSDITTVEERAEAVRSALAESLSGCASRSGARRAAAVSEMATVLHDLMEGTVDKAELASALENSGADAGGDAAAQTQGAKRARHHLVPAPHSLDRYAAILAAPMDSLHHFLRKSTPHIARTTITPPGLWPSAVETSQWAQASGRAASRAIAALTRESGGGAAKWIASRAASAGRRGGIGASASTATLGASEEALVRIVREYADVGVAIVSGPSAPSLRSTASASSSSSSSSSASNSTSTSISPSSSSSSSSAAAEMNEDDDAPRDTQLLLPASSRMRGRLALPLLGRRAVRVSIGGGAVRALLFPCARSKGGISRVSVRAPAETDALWTPSSQHIFRRLTQIACALGCGRGEEGTRDLLTWLASLEDLFDKPCASCCRVPRKDPVTGELMPPIIREPPLWVPYHIDCASGGGSGSGTGRVKSAGFPDAAAVNPSNNKRKRN